YRRMAVRIFLRRLGRSDPGAADDAHRLLCALVPVSFIAGDVRARSSGHVREVRAAVRRLLRQSDDLTARAHHLHRPGPGALESRHRPPRVATTFCPPCTFRVPSFTSTWMRSTRR